MGWDRFPDHLEAAAPVTGPFPHRAFLEAVDRATAPPDSDLLLVADERGGMMLRMGEDAIRLAGDPSLTDYHTPLGDASLVLRRALEPLQGRPFEFDSLPVEAEVVVSDVLRSIGSDFTTEVTDVTAVVDLPSSFDAWLAGIGKKERHEVRRKRRRFIAEFGDIEVVRGGPETFDEFVAMHRTSSGPKGSFMTDDMAALFADLIDSADATIHRLECGGTVRACAFGFETPDAYYYYNSAYDADAAMASPGVVLLSTLVEIQIMRGATVFDFLKGDEPYKYRHGARPRPLSTISGRL